MTRSRSEIDQHRRRTTGEVRAERSGKLYPAGYECTSPTRRRKAPSAPSKIAPKLNRGGRGGYDF
jgi:hypothetical protein